MKQIKCEMCGSTDLIKMDGVFVCQSCGTKYSVEEARKMMIEGTVDVSGSTVRIDNSSSIENYYNMAESAYVSGNNKEAENYCNKIIEIDTNNYRAWLLKGKAAGWQSTLANIRLEEALNCFSRAVDNASPEDVVRVKAEAAKETENLSSALIKLSADHFAKFPGIETAKSVLNHLSLVHMTAYPLMAKCGVMSDGLKNLIANFVNNGAMDAWNNKIWNDYWGDGHPSKYDLTRLLEQASSAVILIKAATSVYEQGTRDDIVRYQNVIAIDTRLLKACSYTFNNGGYVVDTTLTEAAKQEKVNEIMECHQKIKEIDPSYVIPKRPSTKSGGCYVATSVYGSYDCPEVWTLRRYRDYKLAQSWFGRAFIYSYYAVSPSLVRLFGDKKWFRKMWKSKLDRMVKKLQDYGYDSTPYNDIEW